MNPTSLTVFYGISGVIIAVLLVRIWSKNRAAKQASLPKPPVPETRSQNPCCARGPHGECRHTGAATPACTRCIARHHKCCAPHSSHGCRFDQYSRAIYLFRIVYDLSVRGGTDMGRPPIARTSRRAVATVGRCNAPRSGGRRSRDR